MLKNFCGGARPLACLAMAVALLTGQIVPAAAQPAGISADQIQQLQQLYQQRTPAVPPLSQDTQASGNADVMLQPAQFQNVDLPPSRLEQILSTRAGVKLQQFGYDQLGSGRAVRVPQTGAIADDYVLGSGDEIVVSLRGQENSEFRANVDRNGQVLLPRLNPLSATGRTLGDFRADLEAAVRRAYVATNAFVTIGRVRQVSILVSGEVNNPGLRLVTGLSSVVDALLLSGGVKNTGSLRAIRVEHGGAVRTIDLYGVLTSSGGAPSLRLADGDRILVPPLGRTVAVTGLVRRPAIFELPAGQSGISAHNLLNLAGGQEVRGRYRLSILRIQADGRSSLESVAAESGAVHDSEILFVQLGADLTISQATLSGGTGLAGAYAIGEGTHLSDILKAPGALGETPYTLFGLVSRKDARTYLRTLTSFTPVAVLANGEDETLHSDDIVRVLTVNEMRLINSAVNLYVQRQDQAQQALRDPLSDTANQAPPQQQPQQPVTTRGQGGETYQPAPTQTVSALGRSGRSAADRASDQLSDIRMIGNLSQRQLDMVVNGQVRLEDFRVYSPPDAYAPSQGAYLPNENLSSFPGQPQLPNQPPGYPAQSPFPGQPQQQQPYGASTQPGMAMMPPGMGQFQSQLPPPPAANFQEQPSGATVPSNREALTFNMLAQQLGVDPLVLVNFFTDHQITIDGAVRGPGTYFVGPNVALKDLVQAAGGTINWADQSNVELISTVLDPQTGLSATRHSQLPLNTGLLASYVVRPHDEFRFNQVFNDAQGGSVTLQGEVHFTGTYQITRGEHLSDLMRRAGGLTSTSYPYGTVFLRKSAAEKERDSFVRAAKDMEDELVVAMARVGTDKISPDTFASMQTFVNDIRNQKAVGRITVIADPKTLAAKPELDPLLEPGDVIYVPPRPSTVSVLGQVMQPGSFPYRAHATVSDYLERAGGYSVTADGSNTYLVLPDGTARKLERSWLDLDTDDLPPGSTIVVPRDVTPLDLRQTIIDVSQIFSQFAISIASIAVLSRE